MILHKGVLTLFPQCSFSLGFPEILNQNLVRCHQLSLSGNSEVVRCGILINITYSNEIRQIHIGLLAI